MSTMWIGYLFFIVRTAIVITLKSKNMSAKIKIRIDSEGQAHFDVEGGSGIDCESLTRAFEEALGSKINTQYKPEYFCELEDLEQEIYED